MKRTSISTCILAALITVYCAAQAREQVNSPDPPTSAPLQPLTPAKGPNGKWGYQDKSGTFIIPPQFDRAEEFSEGLAAVGLKEKFGYIDSSGHVVIPLKFAHANSFSEGLALVHTTWGMNLLGKVEGVWLFGRAGYIDHTGKFVITPRLVENASDFSEGLAAFEPGPSSWGSAKWGYLDKTGKWAIKPQFDFAGKFSEGLAPVAVSLDQERKRKKWGYIDQAGKLQIPAQFDNAQPFSEGVARVFIGEKDAKFEHMHRPKWEFLGCINRAGEVVKCPTKPAQRQKPAE